VSPIVDVIERGGEGVGHAAFDGLAMRAAARSQLSASAALACRFRACPAP
jgi:hypothetical protein